VDAPLPRVLAVAVVEGDEVATVAAFARVGCLVVEEGLALVGGGVGGAVGGRGGGGGGVGWAVRWEGVKGVEGGVGKGSPTNAASIALFAHFQGAICMTPASHARSLIVQGSPELPILDGWTLGGVAGPAGSSSVRFRRQSPDERHALSKHSNVHI